MWLLALALLVSAEARSFQNGFFGGGVSYTFGGARHLGVYGDASYDQLYASRYPVAGVTVGCGARLRWTRGTDFTGMFVFRTGVEVAPDVGDGRAFRSTAGAHGEFGFAARGRGSEGGFVGVALNAAFVTARIDGVLPWSRPTEVELPRRRPAMATDERRPVADPTLAVGVAFPVAGVYSYGCGYEYGYCY